MRLWQREEVPVRKDLGTPPKDQKKRIGVGTKFLSGAGFEIGAGVRPSLHAGISDLCFIDKRTVEDIARLFGKDPPYQVVSLEDAKRLYPQGRDFVVAHQVLEHCADPIGSLRDWIPLIRSGGRMFISIPSARNACEDQRPATPIEHIVEDYLFRRNGDDYESRQHVATFICQWATKWPDQIWYAGDGVVKFAATLLSETRRDGHDLHWHTYTLQVAVHVMEAAFYFSDAAMRWLYTEETADAIYLVCERTTGGAARPPFLDLCRTKMINALKTLDREYL